ncbi:MAG: amidohydrolase family protein [Novosphingobium sp.]|nr:amidohydrolase family protein [Novosphingobium sp.]
MNLSRPALLLAIPALGLGAAPLPQVDLLIRDGMVYPGAEAPFRGDVAVMGDRIHSLGPRLTIRARRTIDARGLIVAPGFIDPHTHIEPQLDAADPRARLVPGFLMQGVTTAVIGNDGDGPFDMPVVLGRTRIGVNYAAHVGFGAVRKAAIGEADRAPTADELARMKALVARAMCGGAIGFSTGLFYAPQSFARTEEVAAVAAEAAKRGGIYDTHIRDESSYGIGLAAAVDEALAIGRLSGAPVHIAHIKALGVDVHGQAPAIIAKIEAARRAGQRVTADQYPWSASATTLAAALVPGWAQDGGSAALLRRFDDPALRERLGAEMAENLRKRGGPGSLLLIAGELGGRRLDAIARARATDPVSAAIEVIRAGDPHVASFSQSEADIAAFMRRPWVMTGSDAVAGHPRAHGSFARKHARYVRGAGTITLREFIERSTALTADTLGLRDRGRLTPGAFADVVVFDPKRYAERATYDKPARLARGVKTVVVNGVLAVDKGKLTGAAAGRALAKAPSAGTCP